MTSIVFSRLLPSADGRSRFEEVPITFEEKAFAPPARPISVSPMIDASQVGFLRLPAGWFGEMHPSPMRMWIFVLEGRMLFEAADGSRRPLSPGSALLLEDTSGRGHVSQVVGEVPVMLAVVRLADS